MPKTVKNSKSNQVSPINSDTKVGVIEKKYNIKLGVRPDMKLVTFLKKKGYTSLSSMLKDA